MAYKRLSDVCVGDIVTTDVYSDGVLLCRSGVPVSAQMLQVFKYYNIEGLSVKGDHRGISLDVLPIETYRAVRELDITEIVQLCRQTTNNYIQHGVALSSILLDYDTTTFQHSVNVACYASAFALRQGYSQSVLKTLIMGGLLHDIGKTQIPLEILQKPDRLTDAEFKVITNHPTQGYKILKRDPTLEDEVAQIALQHHCNYDGTGYPQGLGAKNYSLMAQLIHICDVYEALRSKRPYKDSIPSKDARKILIQGKGTQFDPNYVDQFIECIPEYITGETLTRGGMTGIVIDGTTVSVNRTPMHIEEFVELTS